MDTASTAKCIILIPAYNEERSIVSVVERLAITLTQSRIAATIVVIDDGSHDSTCQRIETLGTGITVLSGPHQGYHFAIRRGITYAVQSGYTTAILMDGDGQHATENIRSLLNSSNDGADILFIDRGGFDDPWGIRCLKTIGRNVYRLILWSTTRYYVKDPTSGNMRLNRRAMKLLYDVQDKHLFSGVGLIVLARDSGLTFAEVPGTMYRSTRKSRIHPNLVASIREVVVTCWYVLYNRNIAKYICGHAANQR